MFASAIESFIRDLGAPAITEAAIWIMLFIFAAALILKLVDRATRLTQYTPTLLTSIGIFGTFCGIVAGLLGFEITNIDGSIDELLKGMKTAFITSLVGMALSIVFKLFLSGHKKRNKKKTATGAIGINDLYAAMQDQSESLEQLAVAIGGDGDSSLVSQIKLFKSDSNDNHREQYKHMQHQTEVFDTFQEKLAVQMQEFAETLSKSATETVIEALKQVIVDFNQKLTEQFGENFKQLNAAVLELVTWQDNYKQQLGEMQVQYAHGVSAIEQTETAMANISEHTGAIPASMQGLQQIITTNQHQVEELSLHLEAFKDMRDKAVEAVPEIQEQIRATLTGIKTGSEKMITGITESSEKLSGAVIRSADEMTSGSEKISTNLRESGERILTETRNSQKTFETGLEEIRAHLNNTVESVTRKQDEEMQKMFAGLRQQMEKSVADTGESVSKQVGFLDQALEKEMNQSMTELGRALTSITKQFTSDYTDLVNAMHAVTRR